MEYPIELSSVGAGWQPIVKTLHRQLLVQDPEYRVLQVKEKFGALRYYYDTSVGASPEADAMFALVSYAEELSRQICEWCGKAGTQDTDGGFWTLTLCQEHHAERAAKR